VLPACTEYTQGLSREAVHILFKYLPRAYANGPKDFEAREKASPPVPQGRVHGERLLCQRALPRTRASRVWMCVARVWQVHYAATIAGMAFANAFLGICHSMAHKLGAAFHVPHGLANAALISHVIRYNASDSPQKQAAFPQYQYPHA
jgi:acetaldehyde dehydrogenase/alcohol dehydrogenase